MLVQVIEFVFMSMAEGEIEVAFTGFLDGRTSLQLLKNLFPGPLPESAQDIFAAIEAAVNGRGVRACSLGHGPHGESFAYSVFPKLTGGIQDAAFEIRIGLPGHEFVLSEGW